MARIIDGKLIAAQLRKDCLSRSEKLLADGIRPKLDVIIVGNDPASHQYVNSRAADCAAVGLASTVHSLNEDTKQSELIELIETLNADDNVHGILLQMPLPKHMNPDEVISHTCYSHVSH